MSMTVEELEAHLDNAGVKHRLDEDGDLAAVFATETFVNVWGKKQIGVYLRLIEDGEYFLLFAPRVYDLSKCKHVEAVLTTLLQIARLTKLVKFEYDASDGEVRAVVEFPVEDGTMTEHQLMRCVVSIIWVLDRFHPQIQHAINTGEVDFDSEPEELDLSHTPIPLPSVEDEVIEVEPQMLLDGEDVPDEL